MKSKLLLLLVVLTVTGSLTPVAAQENDDMYFSRRDREKLYASTSYTWQSTSSNHDSEYASNHNFYSSTLQSATASSPTVQSGNIEDDNNQYFIKDYSISNKADNEVKTYFGINSNNGYSSDFNSIISFGSYYQHLYLLYCNPYTDVRSPIYNISYMHFDPWNYHNFRYNLTSFYVSRRNPRFNHYYSNYEYNGYTNISNICATTSYSNNVRNEVRYRNGRKVITKSRSSRSGLRPTERPSNGRAIKNTGSNVSTNGRNSGTKSGNTYSRYSNGSQNRSSWNSSSRNSNSSYTRSRSRSTNSNINRRSNSSSGSRSSYSSGSSRSRSLGSSSSNGSRSSGGRRGNN